ncbi:MAG: rhamnulokinase [Lachnospiraceae bacterium]|jgi:rhamnulokinase|nr:rhamnulokinase [Lachnospiraceae bacterium]
MAEKSYLAMDFGASTGRGILGGFDGKKLELKEIHRFRNYYVPVKGKFYWDIFRLYHEIESSVKKVVRLENGRGLCSIGIDTWGTDYGLLGADGQLLGNCRCMRNADGRYVEIIKKRISSKTLFKRTGIQTIYGNTLFQLFERMYDQESALNNAAHFLMLPELLAYFLTGQLHHEYTMATTSMMYDPISGDWDRELLTMLGLPAGFFSRILMPAEEKFDLLDEVQEEMGTKALVYVPVGTHDTASAVAAVPLQQREAFCSSGTWSLLGVEVPKPVITSEAYRANFSNEGTVDGGIRLLKNIMGMWILQQMMKEWERDSVVLSWSQVVQEAQKVPDFLAFIDVEQPEFYQAGHMIEKVRNFCRRTGQRIPESVGELAKCVYESLAMQYRKTLEELEGILGYRISALRIVGGGSQNHLLNQLTANAIRKPVYAGPIECACVGNILVQAMADNELGNLAQLRDVVRSSFTAETFEPENCRKWEEGYEAYMRVIGKRDMIKEREK